MTGESEIVPLRVTPGAGADGSLLLRFPPAYSDELFGLLDEHGIQHDEVLEMSASTVEWIEAVYVIGNVGAAGLVALSQVIAAFVHRNDGKRFSFELNGAVYDAAGYSERFAEHVLEVAEKKAQYDVAVRQELGRDSDVD